MKFLFDIRQGDNTVSALPPGVSCIDMLLAIETFLHSWSECPPNPPPPAPRPISLQPFGNSEDLPHSSPAHEGFLGFLGSEKMNVKKSTIVLYLLLNNSKTSLHRKQGRPRTWVYIYLFTYLLSRRRHVPRQDIVLGVTPFLCLFFWGDLPFPCGPRQGGVSPAFVLGHLLAFDPAPTGSHSERPAYPASAPR